MLLINFENNRKLIKNPFTTTKKFIKLYPLCSLIHALMDWKTTSVDIWLRFFPVCIDYIFNVFFHEIYHMYCE